MDTFSRTLRWNTLALSLCALSAGILDASLALGEFHGLLFLTLLVYSCAAIFAVSLVFSVILWLWYNEGMRALSLIGASLIVCGMPMLALTLL